MIIDDVETVEDYYKVLMNENFKDSLIISYFTADWCGPCKNISPVITNIGENNENIIVIKINVDNCEEISEQCDISCMPTFKFYKNSSIEPVDSFSGADSDNLINTIRNLLNNDNNENSVEIIN